MLYREALVKGMTKEPVLFVPMAIEVYLTLTPTAEAVDNPPGPDHSRSSSSLICVL
jgi:hypothetical protein